jgi:hypothetical protein
MKLTRNLLIVLLALVASASASTLGEQILALPGSVWSFGFSDQLGPDTIFTSAVGTISFDADDDTATIEYDSSSSPNLDFLRVATILGNDGAWILPGQSETFTLPSSTLNLPWPNAPIVYVELLDATGFPFPQLSTGPGNQNIDGYPHAEASEVSGPGSPTPEPGAWVMMLIGGACIAQRRLGAKR